jgi:hypothetical protein
MNHSLLVTMPNFDLTTRYISVWAKKIIKLAQEKGDEVFNLEKKRANRKEFESMMKKNEPTIVFLNGHGDYDLVAGQDNEILVKIGEENEKLLKSKIVYALSCRSGKILGPSSVKFGASAYIGYDEDFIFLYDETKRTRPEQDKTAEMFLEPSNQVMVSLLKNHTPKEAHQNSKQSYVIMKIESRKWDSSSPAARRPETGHGSLPPSEPGFQKNQSSLIFLNTLRIPYIIEWSRKWDSNPRPAVYDTAALPTELLRRKLPTACPATRPATCPGKLLVIQERSGKPKGRSGKL